MRPDDIIQRAEVLGDRVNGHPEHCGAVLPELLRMLPETDDPEVLTALVEALGTRGTRTRPQRFSLKRIIVMVGCGSRSHNG